MWNKLKKETNKTFTENMGVAHATTESAVLDLFSQGGALRKRDAYEIIAIFDKAYSENRNLALKTLFYLRDVRGGQGERRTFRILIKHLANRDPEGFKHIIGWIPEYGRWDDLFELIGTPLEEEALKIIKAQYAQDYDDLKEGRNPSLLAKWMKSENTSSKESREIATKVRKYLGIPSKTYRLQLAELRRKLKIVERDMTFQKWTEIEYGHIPSRASLLYKKAFRKHDEERYEKFLEDVRDGKKKINASTLYPYDVVAKVMKGDEDDTLDRLWDALPNYIEKEENSLAVVDTSGSMAGHPITVSVGLGLYLAERNKGLFHNKFITFSAKPELQEIKGRNIREKVHALNNAHWDVNTDIAAVFRLLLKTAVKYNVPQEEFIDKVYIISDMEFDAANGSTNMWRNYDCPKFNTTVMQDIGYEYDAAGYRLPNMVFWNVNARNSQTPATMHDTGIQLVSGSSPSLFKSLMKGDSLNAYDLMLSVLQAERYHRIKVA